MTPPSPRVCSFFANPKQKQRNKAMLDMSMDKKPEETVLSAEAAAEKKRMEEDRILFWGC